MGVIIFHFQMIKECSSEVKWVVQSHHLACGLWDPIQCPTPHPTHRMWCSREHSCAVNDSDSWAGHSGLWVSVNSSLKWQHHPKDDNRPFRCRLLGFWHTLNERQHMMREAELWGQPGRTGLETGPWCSHWTYTKLFSLRDTWFDNRWITRVTL